MAEGETRAAPRDGTATVAGIAEISPGVLHVALAAPHVSARVRPGQFVMLQVRDGTDPLLRRPLSVCGAAGDRVELLVQVRGRGTGCIAGWRPGERVRMLGPLGNGFNVASLTGAALLAAGGIGIAPLICLARSLSALPGRHWRLFFGGASAQDVACLEAFPLQGGDVAYATEDGSRGYRGLVTELLSGHLQQAGPKGLSGARIYSCGPPAMLQQVARIAAEHVLPCQVSLEARMACGVGACLGCAAGVICAKEPGYRRVCCDGPVFEAAEVDWTRPAL